MFMNTLTLGCGSDLHPLTAVNQPATSIVFSAARYHVQVPLVVTGQCTGVKIFLMLVLVLRTFGYHQLSQSQETQKYYMSESDIMKSTVTTNCRTDLWV